MYVYAIHTTRPNDAVGAVEIIYADEREAREYAESRSTDHTVVSASVTRYVVGQLGARTPLALYLDGRAHPRPDRHTGRLYPTAD
ncbi:hypothetical protein [Pseudonocardia sp.]|uniref:hypothetical protein n=1 Tax=Pseudonocardia sp. TaxID=60912 RepID=UPI003D0A92FA